MHENRAVWRSKNLPWLWPILLFLLSALWVWGLVKPAGATPPADPGPQWVLVWSDEFNGTSIDTTKWNVSNGHSGINNELAYYTPNNVSVSGGNLILVSKNNDFISGATEGYTSGQVNTAGKYEFQYGRVEVRAKLPDGQGIWPAHWTLEGRCSASQVIGGCHFWPPEIDIMERINTEAQVHQTWHPENGAGSGFTVSGTTFATSFHTYEVEWDPGEIRFYVDGVRTGLAQSNITSKNALLILQTAIGGSWPGNPDGTTVFPQYHYIDYVRHLKLCGTCTPQPTATPTQTATPTLTPTVVPSGGSARIESGGTSNYTDSGGNLWVPDAGCSGGGGIVDRGPIAIANTVDDRIYQTERWGLTGCSFNVASGSYTVRLHFAETHVGITGAGQRVFSVNVEGQALNNLDVFAETGGRNIALIKTFVVNVTDGKLTLTFTPNVEQPLINGIEILPPGPTPTPGPSPTPTLTPTPTQTTPNTHGGTWAGKGILDGRSTWKALKQTVSGVATNTSYVGSVWIKGTGPAVDLRVQTGAGTILSAKRCDSIGVWVQCTTPVLNTDSNTSLVLLVVDYYGGDPDGVVYVDDAFLGISGGANKVANPGFESGAVNWTAQVPWSIVNNP